MQSHLKLTKQQISALEMTFKWFAEEARKIQSTAKTRADAMKRLEKVRGTAADRAINALNSTQKARLKQLGLQLYGPFAMLSPEIGKEIGLTAAQKKKLESIRDKAVSQANAVFKERTTAASKVPRPKDQKDQKQLAAYQKQIQTLMQKRNASDQARVKKIQENADKSALAVLTAAQKKKWTAMLGKKFPLANRRG